MQFLLGTSPAESPINRQDGIFRFYCAQTVGTTNSQDVVGSRLTRIHYSDYHFKLYETTTNDYICVPAAGIQNESSGANNGLFSNEIQSFKGSTHPAMGSRI